MLASGSDDYKVWFELPFFFYFLFCKKTHLNGKYLTDLLINIKD